MPVVYLYTAGVGEIEMDRQTNVIRYSKGRAC